VELCENAATLSVATGFVAYLWSTGSTTNSTTIPTSGNYWVRVTDNHCSNTDTTYARIKLLPRVDAGSNNVSCNEAILRLNAKANNHTSAHWMDNSFGTFSDKNALNSSFSVSPEVIGERTLRIMATNSCGSDSDELVVDFTPKVPADFISDTLVCERSPLVLLQALVPGGQFSGPFVKGTSFNPVKAGFYPVTYRITNNGCVDSISKRIRVVPTPVASFTISPRTPTIDKEVEFASTSEKATTYLWKFHDGKRSTQPATSHYYPKEGSYWVELVAINEICRDSTGKSVVIEGSENIWAPNAFTPNDDGLNDVFRVHYNNSKGALLMIYNRWGQEIFRTENMEEGWDGQFKNEPCQDDVYVWIVSYLNNDDVRVEKNGTVTLLH